MSNKNTSLSYRDFMDMARRRTSELYLQQKLQKKVLDTVIGEADFTRTSEKDSDEVESVNTLPAKNGPTQSYINTSFPTPEVLTERTPDFNRSTNNIISPVSPLKVLEEVYSRYLF